jgi:plasmid maintenance system killer protein
MNKGCRHKGIQQLFEADLKAGIAAEYESKLTRQLTVLSAVKGPLEMDVAYWKPHQLKAR